MGDIIDPEILMIAGIILFVFLILNILFRLFSMPKFIKSSLIVVSFVGIVLLVFTYITDHEQIYANVEENTSNYVVGKVTFVSKTMKKINMDYIKSNVRTKATEKYVVKLKGSTVVYLKDAGVTQKGSINDIRVGDIITVNCVEDTVPFDDAQITAIQVVKKGASEEGND